MVLSLDTRLSLEADECAVVAFLDQHGGVLLRDLGEPGVYWAVLRPVSAPEETYYARIQWRVYPEAAASVRYHDGIGGSTAVMSAWPQVPGYRTGSWDICKPFTAEGYALHSEWQTGAHAWDSRGNPFLYTVQTLQFDLNFDYSGRHA